MKAGVILPHTRLYGGVKRFIELGRIFSGKGHTFTLYTPDGISPDWTTTDLRVAKFEALASEEMDILFTTSRKNKDVFVNAHARYKHLLPSGSGTKIEENGMGQQVLHFCLFIQGSQV